MTTEPQTATADEIERAIVPHGPNGECSDPDLCTALTDFRLAIEAEAAAARRPTQTDLEVSADLLRQYAQGIRPGPTGRQLAERMAKRLEEAMR